MLRICSNRTSINAQGAYNMKKKQQWMSGMIYESQLITSKSHSGNFAMICAFAIQKHSGKEFASRQKGEVQSK